ncbi:uncharacterized protein LOC129924253 isoform X1 [Biomphalaria glabrata]|uniref:Uncharacterized protein LOC129924253 isoform X1 n=1 Tax=Biomphalaria glabrata TaxID=6526 RepID=A0A9W2ZHM5_BIOGL|nr:uncharacterized protein LOC129924253 isoform X1 [Biomphalaria glabrata]
MATTSGYDLEEFRKKLIHEAKTELELRGKELTAYVQQMVAAEAERLEREKARGREKEKEEADRIEREKVRETEKLEREKVREAEKLEREKVREAERVEREKKEEAERIEREKKEEADRKVRIQVEQMRIEAGISVPTEGNSNNSANIESHSSAAWTKKKIQPFAEDKDDIGDYLKRFEIKLAKFNVQEKEWSEILLDFVHGKALTICQNHDHSMQNSYQVLKKELLNAYGHNAETFRKKYYENTPSSQVDPQTTINSEKDFFTKWLAFENVENTYEGLKNFILIDNFINKCDPQLQSFVKERNPKVIEDLVEIIRIFKNAYPNNPLSVSDHKKVIDLVNYVKRNDVSDRDYCRRNDRSRERGNNGRDSYDGIKDRSWENENKGRESYDRRIDRPKADDRNFRDVTCFNCQEKGHMAYQCKKHRGNGAGNRNAQGNSGTSDRRGNRENRRQERDNRPPDRVNFVRSIQDRDRDSGHGEPDEEINYVDCGEDRFKLYPGMINNKQVNVIRDTASSTLAVRGGLVKSKDYLGYTKSVRLADGAVKRFEACKVFLRSPLYTGYCEGVAMPRLSRDVLLGNVAGVSAASDKQVRSWKSRYGNMRRNKPRNDRICFNCHKHGHIAKDCWSRAEQSEQKIASSDRRRRSVSGSDDRRDDCGSGNRKSYRGRRPQAGYSGVRRDVNSSWREQMYESCR